MRGSSDIEPVYRELLNSDFVSLFAATNPFDGFAQSYAMYVHVVLQGKPLVTFSPGKRDQ